MSPSRAPGAKGPQMTGKQHKIYLSDRRRVLREKTRTVHRQLLVPASARSRFRPSQLRARWMRR